MNYNFNINFYSDYGKISAETQMRKTEKVSTIYQRSEYYYTCEIRSNIRLLMLNTKICKIPFFWELLMLDNYNQKY